jgi:transcriptional regulator with XRE-family HTH domain
LFRLSLFKLAGDLRPNWRAGRFAYLHIVFMQLIVSSICFARPVFLQERAMNLGAWLRQLRRERGLNLETLAAQTDVEASTISRIENEQTQATLDTTVRLCEALGVTAADLGQAIQGRKFAPHSPRGRHRLPPDAVLVMEDVDAFVAFFHANPQRSGRLLADLLNQVAHLQAGQGVEKLQRELPLFAPEDIERLIAFSPLYRFELQYPPHLEAAMILEIGRLGGVLTPTDVGMYLQQARRKKKVTLVGLEGAVQVSASVLSRLEGGSVDRVKLMEALALDEALGEKGNLLTLYWSASKFSGKSVRYSPKLGPPVVLRAGWTEQESRLVDALILTCRWLQCLTPGNAAWLTDLRRELKVSSPDSPTEG